MQHVEDKIEKAKQIYYRRNGIKYRGEAVQDKRKINIWFIIVVIIVGVYAYQNKDFFQSAQFSNRVKSFLNTPINFKNLTNIFDVHKSDNVVEHTENAVESKTEESVEETNNLEEPQGSSIIWPVNGSITSSFGERESVDPRVTTNHTGIDISGNERRFNTICYYRYSCKCL